MAQLVEHRTPNPRVGGSSPSGRAPFRGDGKILVSESGNMAAQTEQVRNPISRGINFLREAWIELKKVHPPTRQETMQATIVVLMMVVLFATFLGLADYIVGNIMQAILT